MDSPSTSQKRKYDAYDEAPSEGATETTDEESTYSGYSRHSLHEHDRTPTKRLKSSGTFEHVGHVGKRKHYDRVSEYRENELCGSADVKRRRV
jgi:hypothetical protein